MPTLPTKPKEWRALFQNFSASGEDLERQVGLAVDSDYWLKLFHRYSISAGSGTEQHCEDEPRMEKGSLREATQNYHEQGWTSVEGLFTPRSIKEMGDCVEAVRKAGWPPAFTFVYDQFWMIGRSRGIRALLSELLGTDYVAIPRIWTYFVQPTRGNAGWKPHIDGSDKTRNITIWIPLSEATLANGCIYVVRRNKATELISDNYSEMESFTKAQITALLHSVRAVPAKPGQVLCWGEHVIHWGSLIEPAEDNQPRTSIAMEFSRPDFPLSEDDPFVVPNDGPLPNFRARLETISRAILSYRRFEILAERFVPLAEKILASSPRE